MACSKPPVKRSITKYDFADSSAVYLTFILLVEKFVPKISIQISVTNCSDDDAPGAAIFSLYTGSLYGIKHYTCRSTVQKQKIYKNTYIDDIYWKDL